MEKNIELVYKDTKEALVIMGVVGMLLIGGSFLLLFSQSERELWSDLVLIVCDGVLFVFFAILAWSGFHRKYYAVIDAFGIHVWENKTEICSAFWTDMKSCGYFPRYGRFP